MLLEEVLRRSSLCIPAFMVAVAASECGGVCEAGGDCDMVGKVSDCAWRGVEEGEGEGGREFRSGGIVER